LGGRGRRISDFEASLIYKVSSRTARAIPRNPVSKNNKQTNKQTNKKAESSNFIHTNIHAYIHIHIHTCIQTYIQTYSHSHIEWIEQSSSKQTPNIPHTQIHTTGG
jgi:SH3-like domain-containing protein